MMRSGANAAVSFGVPTVWLADTKTGSAYIAENYA